jgi:hypothetical protein
MARGVLSSWAAEARASRQLLQCSSLKTSNFCRRGATFAGCMSTAPFLAFDGRDDASTCTLSGEVPKVCSTGILSTKVSLRFSNSASPREIERSRLYRGRTDISATRLKVNQNLRILSGNVQNSSLFRKAFAFPRYSCSPEPQEIAILDWGRGRPKSLMSNKSEGLLCFAQVSSLAADVRSSQRVEVLTSGRSM